MAAIIGGTPFMPDDGTPMPPLPALREDLRTTTERIARELASPAAEAPAWSDLQWRVAMAAAVMHGVSGLLAGRLRWRGPEAWSTFLEQQRAQGILRQRRTQVLLAEIDAAARQARIPLVALKGSVLLDLDLYAPGERPMSDVDLLCSAQDFEAADRLIGTLGYVPGSTNWRHVQYLPAGTGEERAFGEHIANPVKIELHGRVLERLPVRDVDITAQVFPGPARAGLNPYPSLAALMRHLVLHAAGNVCNQSVRLIHLHDIAALARRLTREDWDALVDAGDGRTMAWWALPPLSLVDRYFPGRIPPGVLERVAAACPPLLRRASRDCGVADVSLSRLDSPVLPGWAWSRSMADVLALALTRLHPGRDAGPPPARSALDHWLLVPSGWTRLPRWERGLRILAGRAPRAATMYSVRRALDYAPLASAPYSSSTRVKV
jgi:hypothetical protein